MSDLNIALVGCGRISGHHAQSINQVDGIRLAAVCDLVSDRATDYARAHNVPAFESYHEMLAQVPEIDIVSINTPSGMHHEHALDMIERYGKNVVVEKPTFMRPSQLDSALAAAETLQQGCRPRPERLAGWRARRYSYRFGAAALVPSATVLRYGTLARDVLA